MSMQPPNSGFSGHSQGLDPHGGGGGDTTGARPAGQGQQRGGGKKGGMPLGFTAGGGLLVGVLAGLLLISGGGDTSEAVASKNADGPTEVKVATTYGDLAAEDGTGGATETEPSDTTGSAPEGQPDVDPGAATAGSVDPDPAVVTPEPAVLPEPVVVPEPKKVEPAPEPIDVDLRFEVSGLEGGDQATITLGDDVVSGTSTTFSIAAGKTKERVKLVVKAPGYRVFKKTLDVSSDMTVAVDMRKKPAAGSGGSSKPKPKGQGPGGLLDL